VNNSGWRPQRFELDQIMQALVFWRRHRDCGEAYRRRSVSKLAVLIHSLRPRRSSPSHFPVDLM
jgi:hypothetical protein